MTNELEKLWRELTTTRATGCPPEVELLLRQYYCLGASAALGTALSGMQAALDANQARLAGLADAVKLVGQALDLVRAMTPAEVTLPNNLH